MISPHLSISRSGSGLGNITESSNSELGVFLTPSREAYLLSLGHLFFLHVLDHGESGFCGFLKPSRGSQKGQARNPRRVALFKSLHHHQFTRDSGQTNGSPLPDVCYRVKPGSLMQGRMGEYQERLSQDEATPSRAVQRRRRPPLSCSECRRRKLKCDRSLPCGQCVRSKTVDSCVFNGPQPGSASEPSRHMSPPVSRMPGGSDNQSAAGGMFVFDSKIGPKNSNRVVKRSQLDELHDLRERLRKLENALARPNALATPNALQTPEASVCDIASEIGTSYHSAEAFGVDDRVRLLPDASFRGKKGKTRYFGRSHYTTTVSFVSTY